MKKFLAWALAAILAIPTVCTAQTFTFSTNTSPGITVSTNPFGTDVGVTTPYFNTVYTSEGYYDAYGYWHPTRGYRHKSHKKSHKSYRHHNGRYQKAHHKAMKKARKAYQKEMRRQSKHHRHHHD